ncbi:Aspartyl/Asparaginyl beta-hydroxylase [Mycobacteroides abscessus subsp. abscessus]|uniref:aspartyl/asparaginyl beta-hydroxylase domain-containing protein n=1 Tax=Mycobacteroides abscessus TaxID=36809 RepID=UPI00025846A6|nr:aspartyl/asparaginyl beta-hydroxylase domain-containing protein [Mycobacteroides abscessus]EIC67548.1 aspartyl/Asparaginyl beta-hydroxylase [Mycobacteroides abscessus M93]CPV55641.1 Aspartyl/Asparaginyl beta-hydroxylase [Mycobacteroides abscessus]SHQ64110.1 Aspartyl/Asparaginyl beta-hydroxylase [Mycobacteroides abscessus subsp. abscessus]SHR33278.1 Aspartyl/Asparaginyl beta-hydroxylase [Mycobacteroides abscessus subsp. abscessus]SHZ30578.1 Aspartyl/Asparaginyl beta-hydroxylase [Mycobacteroi
MTQSRRAAARDLGRLLLGHLPRYRNSDLQQVVARALRDEDAGNRWIVNVVNGSLRVRQRVDYALRLTPRRLSSRVRHRWRAHPSGEAPRAISLLCPTRSRVGYVKEFLDSVRRTAAAPGRIEVLFYVDDDDPDRDEYVALFNRARWLFGEIGRCELLVGPPVGVPMAWNQLAEKASGDLLLMANDDQLYVDYAWDAALDSRVGELTRLHPDAVLCLYFDAGQYPEGGPDFPILTRRWYDTVGYFTPTIFQQWEVEQWLFDIAERLGRLFSVPGIFVEHRHYQDYKSPFDATYQRHRMSREGSMADHALFLRTEQMRAEEVHKLQCVINATETGGSQEVSAEPSPAPPVPVTVPAAVRRRYAALIDAMHASGWPQQAAECAQQAVRQGVWQYPWQRPVDYRADLPLIEEYDAGDMWFSGLLADNHAVIAAEAHRFLGAEGERLPVAAGDWQRLALYDGDGWSELALQHFPATVSLLTRIPEVLLTAEGTVEILVLQPHTIVAPRCGRTNATLGVEFGIQSDERARLRLGRRSVTWREGECLIFDGGLERQVWHEGASPHVVLSFQIPHAAAGSGAPLTVDGSSVTGMGR